VTAIANFAAQQISIFLSPEMGGLSSRTLEALFHGATYVMCKMGRRRINNGQQTAQTPILAAPQTTGEI